MGWFQIEREGNMKFGMSHVSMLNAVTIGGLSSRVDSALPLYALTRQDPIHRVQ